MIYGKQTDVQHSGSPHMGGPEAKGHKLWFVPFGFRRGKNWRMILNR